MIAFRYASDVAVLVNNVAASAVRATTRLTQDDLTKPSNLFWLPTRLDC